MLRFHFMNAAAVYLENGAAARVLAGVKGTCRKEMGEREEHGHF